MYKTSPHAQYTNGITIVAAGIRVLPLARGSTRNARTCCITTMAFSRTAAGTLQMSYEPPARRSETFVTRRPRGVWPRRHVVRRSVGPETPPSDSYRQRKECVFGVQTTTRFQTGFTSQVRAHKCRENPYKSRTDYDSNRSTRGRVE